jgi:hypothetical protein
MNSSQKFSKSPSFKDGWIQLGTAFRCFWQYREFWRYIDWLCEHFFPFQIPILKNSSLIGIFKKFQKMFNNFYPKSSFFLTIVPTAILTGRSVPRWWWLSNYQKLGHFSKSRLFFVDPQQVVLMLTRLRAVWHVLLVSNFEFLVNLKIFWGGEV